MRILCSAALLFLLAGTTAAADKKASSGNWLTRMFGGKAKAPEPKKETPKLPKVDAPASKAALHEARQKYMQRVQVCDKLREIALQTGDDAMARRADQLEDRVWNAYRAQLDRLSNASGQLSIDEQSLDRSLDLEAGRNVRPTGSPTASAGRAAPGLAGRK
jgi:hypothetical protein